MCPRSHTPPTLSIGVAVCLLGVLVVFVGIGSVPAETAAAQSSATNETVTTEIQLQPDGDADWTVSVTLHLDTDDEVTAFRETAARFEAGDNGDSDQGLDLGLSAFRAASERMSDLTGREMDITAVNRTSELVTNDSAETIDAGRLTLSFTWTNFATVDGDRLIINDVLATEQGPWLERLGDNERLFVRGPPDYLPQDAGGAANITNGTLCWKGPITFDESSLAATFVGDQPEPPPPPGDDGPPGDDSPPTSENGPPVVLWSGVAAAAIATAVLGYLAGRRFELGLPRPGGADESNTAIENETAESGPAQSADSAAAAEAGDGGGANRTAGTGVGTDAGAGAGIAESSDGIEAGTGTGTEAEAEEPGAPELLSDEERVERLLRANGGRMKQAVIVEETGWSNAKVSQLLSTMNENDQIKKLRIGRENLITVPEQDPGDIGE